MANCTETLSIVEGDEEAAFETAVFHCQKSEDHMPMHEAVGEALNSRGDLQRYRITWFDK